MDRTARFDDGFSQTTAYGVTSCQITFFGQRVTNYLIASVSLPFVTMSDLGSAGVSVRLTSYFQPADQRNQGQTCHPQERAKQHSANVLVINV